MGGRGGRITCLRICGERCGGNVERMSLRQNKIWGRKNWGRKKLILFLSGCVSIITRARVFRHSGGCGNMNGKRNIVYKMARWIRKNRAK